MQQFTVKNGIILFFLPLFGAPCDPRFKICMINTVLVIKNHCNKGKQFSLCTLLMTFYMHYMCKDLFNHLLVFKSVIDITCPHVLLCVEILCVAVWQVKRIQSKCAGEDKSIAVSVSTETKCKFRQTQKNNKWCFCCHCKNILDQWPLVGVINVQSQRCPIRTLTYSL